MKVKASSVVFAIVMLIAAVLLIFGIQRCGFMQESVTSYTLNSNKEVQVSYDEKHGYTLTADAPFNIEQEGVVIATGEFVTAEGYDNYERVMTSDDDATMIETDAKKGQYDYLMWSYADGSYSYLLKINDEGLAIKITSMVSEEVMQELFKNLSFKVIE